MKANQAFKNNDEAVSPVIGVILMVAITVVLAAVVFVLVTKLAGNQKDQSPSVTFSKKDNPSTAGGVLTVVAVQGAQNVLWTDIKILPTGCTSSDGNGDTYVTSGETITCTANGPFSISYGPTNTLLSTQEFHT